jgi:hypothetical protein
VVIKASKDSDSPTDILGLTTNASWQENFGLQEAVIIGHFGPVSIDPQSYNCSITLDVFIPRMGKIGNYSYDAQISKSIFENLPAKDDIFTNATTGLKLTIHLLGSTTGIPGLFWPNFMVLCWKVRAAKWKAMPTRGQTLPCGRWLKKKHAVFLLSVITNET